jgi:hypothetical protein
LPPARGAEVELGGPAFGPSGHVDKIELWTGTMPAGSLYARAASAQWESRAASIGLGARRFDH